MKLKPEDIAKGVMRDFSTKSRCMLGWLNDLDMGNEFRLALIEKCRKRLPNSPRGYTNVIAEFNDSHDRTTTASLWNETVSEFEKLSQQQKDQNDAT